MQLVIRNDDVAFDTNLDNFKRFCDTCDKYNVEIIQCITPIGKVINIEKGWTNEDIVRYGGPNLFTDNLGVYMYLEDRYDKIAVHGLWHTHEPTTTQIATAIAMLKDMNLTPEYFVPPFNEGVYDSNVAGLKLLQNVERIEDFLHGMPKHGHVPKDIVAGKETIYMYLHDWRFDGSWYQMEDLDVCLNEITNMMSK